MNNLTVFNIVLKHGKDQANLYMATDYNLPISVGESIFVAPLVEIAVASITHHVAKRERHVHCKMELVGMQSAKGWLDDLVEAGFVCWQASGVFKAAKAAQASQQPEVQDEPEIQDPYAQLAWLVGRVAYVADYLHKVELRSGKKSYLAATRYARIQLARATHELSMWVENGIKPEF